MTTVGNINYCYDAKGNQTAVGGPAVATTGTTTQTAVATNADGSKTVTTTTTNNATGQQTTASQNYASGATLPVTPGTSWSDQATLSGGGGGAPIDGTTGLEQGSTGDFCAKNPSSNMCKTTSAGTSATVGTLYTADTSGKTFSSVLTDAKDTVTGSGWYSGMSGFFGGDLVGGSCDGMATVVELPVGGSLAVDFAWLCSGDAVALYSILSISLLIAATWLAFVIAFL